MQAAVMWPGASWVILLVAPFIGSFLALFAERFPKSAPIVTGRSRCSACGRVLQVRDLIPVVSWIGLRGRCRTCKARIGLFPLIMELAALGIAGWAATETTGFILVASGILGWWLLLLGTIDAREFLLPDILTLPLVVAGLAISWWLMPDALLEHVIGAAGGFVIFAAIALLYRAIRGREGLGLGDAKLMAALGAWLSWQGLPTVVLIAALTALAFALLRSAFTREWSLAQRIPFGSFLAIGGWIVWLYGPLVFG